MGVDLSLLVVDSESPAMALAHARLPMQRDCDIWDAIETMTKFACKPLPPVYGFFGDEYREMPAVDPYGRPLMYAEAGKLAGALEEVIDCSDWNNAVGVFLSALPQETKVIFWWH